VPKVLIVDDAAFMRMRCTKLLTDNGFETAEAADGAESIEMYKKGSRQDLVDKETEEIRVIEKYLPEQLSDEEIRALIRDTIAEEEEANKKNFGIIMKKVIGKIKNRAEGSKVNRLVKEIIDGIK